MSYTIYVTVLRLEFPNYFCLQAANTPITTLESEFVPINTLDFVVWCTDQSENGWSWSFRRPCSKRFFYHSWLCIDLDI